MITINEGAAFTLIEGFDNRVVAAGRSRFRRKVHAAAPSEPEAEDWGSAPDPEVFEAWLRCPKCVGWVLEGAAIGWCRVVTAVFGLGVVPFPTYLLVRDRDRASPPTTTHPHNWRRNVGPTRRPAETVITW